MKRECYVCGQSKECAGSVPRCESCAPKTEAKKLTAKWSIESIEEPALDLLYKETADQIREAIDREILQYMNTGDVSKEKVKSEYYGTVKLSDITERRYPAGVDRLDLSYVYAPYIPLQVTSIDDPPRMTHCGSEKCDICKSWKEMVKLADEILKREKVYSMWEGKFAPGSAEFETMSWMDKLSEEEVRQITGWDGPMPGRSTWQSKKIKGACWSFKERDPDAEPLAFDQYQRYK